jgi:hypothetical protein
MICPVCAELPFEIECPLTGEKPDLNLTQDLNEAAPRKRGLE